MSGTGPSYGPADPYKQPGYPPGDIPLATSYPSGPPYQHGPTYPSGEPTAPPPPYAENMDGYPSDSKPYHPGSSPYPPGDSGYPPSGHGYPQSGYPPSSGPAFPGYMPGRAGLVPPRMMPPPSSAYQQNPEDQQRIITGNDGQDGWASSSFTDKRIRHMFIRKVYLILMCQLLVTVAFIAVFIFCKPIKNWVRNNMWFYGLSYAVFIIMYIVLVCCDSVRRRWPANFICLAVFTLAMSYMTGTISSVYDTDIVLIAIAITALVCLAISIFAIQTKIDFTLCSGLIFVLAMVLVLFGLACMIVYAVSGPNYILSCVYGGVAAAIFSVFLVFDTQMVVGGKHRRYQLSPEEHIYGALQLYVDVVNLFILLLGLIGNRE